VELNCQSRYRAAALLESLPSHSRIDLQAHAVRPVKPEPPHQFSCGGEPARDGRRLLTLEPAAAAQSDPPMVVVQNWAAELPQYPPADLREYGPITESDRINWNPNQLIGQPCIRGLRLTVRRVIEALAIYPNRDDLFRNYPELDPEDIRQVLAFRHRESRR